LGFVVLRFLTESPADAEWLPAAQREALIACLERERRAAAEESPAAALRRGRTWLLALVYFTLPLASYGTGFWLPQILNAASGAGTFAIGWLSAVPYAAGVLVMVVAGRHSDRTGERRWHYAIAAVVSAIGLLLTPLGSSVPWIIFCLSVTTIGYASTYGPFWALTTASMRGVGAAASIALVNSIGNTGGFVGPYLLGAINDATHSFAAGLWVIAAILALGGSVVLFVPEK